MQRFIALEVCDELDRVQYELVEIFLWADNELKRKNFKKVNSFITEKTRVITF